MNDKTKKRYAMALESALNSKLSFDDYVESLKDKHQINKLKSGIKNNDHLLESEKIKLIEVINGFNKQKYKKNNEEQFKLKTALNRINLLKSKRLKLSFRFQLISGLRISELSNLEFKDIFLKDNEYYVNVRQGKGNKDRTVKLLKDDYAINNILELDTNNNNKVFCSVDYLQKQAKLLGFHTHDLRKAYSQITYYNDYDNPKKAIKNLQNNLGHCEKSSTYKKYLGRDINLTGTKFDLNKQNSYINN